jgi:hypothetical protein
MTEQDKPRCETCRYRGELYALPDHGIAGQNGMGGMTFKCRRHAPLITGGLHSPTMTVWPVIRLDDWCGDHLKGQTDDR